MLNNKGYILKFRDSKFGKGITYKFIFSLVAQIVIPLSMMSLTEGPSQPEVQSFEPIGTTDMVDLFTGDFNYNIPLFNLPGPNGGYPVNIAYHAGVTPDDEASWVGLGWNLNVGSMVRNMRGLPDEFKSISSSENENAEANLNSDYLEVKSDIKESRTFGINASLKNSMSIEVLGLDTKKIFNSVSNSLSLYYNNYNGFGLGYSINLSNKKSSGAYVGVGLSLDTEEGVGVNASLSLAERNSEFIKTHSLGINFNGKISLDYSLTREEYSIYKGSKDPLTGNRVSVVAYGKGVGVGSSISFARNAFSPSLPYKMNNFSISLSMKTGTEAFPTHISKNFGVFFQTQDLNDKEKKGKRHLVMGYDKNGESLEDTRFLLDFQRERDGQVTDFTPYLPVSHYTYDTYFNTGQGIMGYFRPYRNDVGRVYDPKLDNYSFGAVLGFEAGAGGGSKVGLDPGLSYGRSSQDAWSIDNELDFGFNQPYPYSTAINNENLVYAVPGEGTIHSADRYTYLKKNDIIKTRLYNGKMTLGENQYPDQQHNSDEKRFSRKTTIHNFKNSEVGHLGEFSIKYADWSSSLDLLNNNASQTFNRTTRNAVDIDSHYAGFKVLNTEGAYYVYGLPAYNNVEVENLFSTQGGIQNYTNQTDLFLNSAGDEVDYKRNNSGHKFIHKTKKSPYAHSYLLTSVLGADYVDITNDGPTNDDLGYWVKFTYVKKASNYKWRAPYHSNKGVYSPGASYTDEDDKASYSYGEKELWYVGKIETKTHVAVFEMSERDDMKEAYTEISESQNTDLNARQSGLKLDRIRVYSKKELTNPIPKFLSEVKFSYSYNLCMKAPNSKNNMGKLTLDSIVFNSNGSTRGDLNAYKFTYANGQTSGNLNPDYHENWNDMWGSYKPVYNDEQGSNFPYVNQFNQDWNSAQTWEPTYTSENCDHASAQETKSGNDNLAKAWKLSKIELPSGGQINIDYESDDYGYVQHKTANQMFRIVSMGIPGQADKVFQSGTNYDDANDKRRIYFKLEKPIPVSYSEHDRSEEIYKRYVKPIHEENGERYLYFKTKMNLTKNVQDYVSGYLPLEDNKSINGLYTYGCPTANDQIDGKSTTETIDGVQCFTHGYVTLKATAKVRKPTSNYKYHPMAIAGWVYLQTNAQRLLEDAANFDDNGNGNGALLSKLGAFINILPEMLTKWGGIRKYCNEKEFCNKIDLNKSVIRLASPDKIKYGGGYRVKQITITDKWSGSTGNTTDDRTYGTTYDYTITENGEKISSGVACYEPQAGGDENALKYPYFYAEKMNYFTRNNLFAEAPFNESLFPAPSVGYRKVTIKSLNTKIQLDAQTGSGRTNGVTEYEFYTSKEFPTMVSATQLAEENSTLDVLHLPIPIPLIGSLRFDYYRGTQGYMIELNDMHGKLKSMKTFEINNYSINPNPITESSYEYQCEPISYMGEKVFRLVNEVDVISNDGTHLINPIKKLKGLDVEVYTDQRESDGFNLSAAVDFNLDLPPLPVFPGMSFWPSYSQQKTMFRTYVTNKVVNRYGILSKVKSRDLQTSNESENVAYDEISGNPILVKTKNEFGDDFYSYSIPAYYAYEGMGHAYKNINYKFNTTLIKNSDGPCYYTFDATGHVNNLVRGDELLVNGYKCYFLGWTYSGTNKVKGILHDPYNGLQGDNIANIDLKVIRSGRRNHIDVMAANYLTKGKIEASNLSDLPLTLEDGSDYTAKKINANVLSATASLFKDTWRDEINGIYNFTTSVEPDPRRPGEYLYTDMETFLNADLVNPYVTGAAGIWRGYKAYTWVDKRKNSSTLSYNTSDQNPKLFDDGVFINSVPLFDWKLALPEYEYIYGWGSQGSPFAKWEWTNEITRFNYDGYETENVNRLDIKSSALYGYNNSLSIGVGGNASKHEIGVLDFENIDVNQSTVQFGQTVDEHNLNFYNSTSNAPNKTLITEHYKIQKAYYNAGTGNLDVTIKFKSQADLNLFKADFNNTYYNATYPSGYSSPTSPLSNSFGLALISKVSGSGSSLVEGNKHFYINGYKREFDAVDNGNLVLTCYLKPYLCDKDDVNKYLPSPGYFYGTLTALKKVRIAKIESVAGAQFIKNGTDGMKAHSGKQMLKVSGSLMFEQPRLNLSFDGKKYTYSLWVSRASQDVKSYQTSQLVELVRIAPNNSFYLLSNVTAKYGKVIEGWQKVDLEFTPGTSSGFVPGDILAFRFNAGSNALYIDDVRFSPKTGGMKSFVYDPGNYRLTASLNVDNYATFFYYNDQGALNLTKQETEKGIFTVSESRARLKK